MIGLLIPVIMLLTRLIPVSRSGISGPNDSLERHNRASTTGIQLRGGFLPGSESAWLAAALDCHGIFGSLV